MSEYAPATAAATEIRAARTSAPAASISIDHWLRMMELAAEKKIPQLPGVTANDAIKAHSLFGLRRSGTDIVKERPRSLARAMGFNSEHDERLLRKFLLRQERHGVLRREYITGYGRAIRLVIPVGTNLQSWIDADHRSGPPRSGPQQKLFGAPVVVVPLDKENNNNQSGPARSGPPLIQAQETHSAPSAVGGPDRKADPQGPDRSGPADKPDPGGPLFQELLASLTARNVPMDDAEELIRSNTPDEVRTAITCLDQSKTQVGNVVRWLKDAIKRKFKPKVAAPPPVKPPQRTGYEHHDAANAITRAAVRAIKLRREDVKVAMEDFTPDEREDLLDRAIAADLETYEATVSLKKHVDDLRSSGADPFRSSRVLIALHDLLVTSAATAEEADHA